jgi:hypothetical protein
MYPMRGCMVKCINGAEPGMKIHVLTHSHKGRPEFDLGACFGEKAS